VPENVPIYVPDQSRASEARLDPAEARAFAEALSALNNGGIPYLVAGAFAKHAYTGVWRDTKDLDVFLEPADLHGALSALHDAGFRTYVEDPRWLAKARREPYFLDLIFGAGNGRMIIDGRWFERAGTVEIAGVRARLIPIEELLVSKLYVAARDRFDGADIVHLIRSAGGKIDWERVLALLRPEDSELLLWHLLLFDFVYPGHASYLPQGLMLRLFEDLRQRWRSPGRPTLFRGTLLDQVSYGADVHDGGYEDGRDGRPLVDAEGRCL
jgi:hypothetical protein